MDKTLKKPENGTHDYISNKIISDGDDNSHGIDLDKIDYNIVGRFTRDKKRISREILETFPELEFILNIIISSMTAPTDVITDTIAMSTENTNLFDAETRTELLKTFKDDILNYYKIEERIYDIIKTAMVTDGAYCELILPEQMIDQIMFTTGSANLESAVINRTAENYQIETDNDDREFFNYVGDYITPINDPSVMKLGELSLDANLEGDDLSNTISKAKSKKILDAVFKDGVTDTDTVKNLFALSTKVNKSQGRPFRMQIPAEAVTPISYKHDPKKHLGYVITLDENYMPISGSSYTRMNGMKKDENDDLSNALVLTRSIIEKAKEKSAENEKKEPRINELDDIASTIIDNKLKNMVVGNKLSELVDTEMLNSIYLVMLNRALKKQKTKILFIPKEYLWYVAANYRDNGTGKTVLEDLASISSLRSLLRHARVFGNLRSVLPLEKYDITIDDDVKGIDKVIAKARNFINRNRSMTMPNGLVSSTDVTDWLHNSGVVLNITHKDVPTFDIEGSVMDMDIKIPDSDIDEELRRATYMKIGIAPEIAESALSDADFAGTINTQNLMFARDNIRKQKPYNKALKEFSEIIIKHDFTLRNKVIDILEKRFKQLLGRLDDSLIQFFKDNNIDDDAIMEYLINEFIKIFKISLPKIENFEDNALDKQFEARLDNIEKVIDLHLSSDVISEELSGSIGEKLEDIKDAMKAALLRQWMAENNYMPELFTLFTKTEDGVSSTPLEDYKLFVENAKEAFINYKKKTVKDVKKTDKKLDELDEYELPEENEDNSTPGEKPSEGTGNKNDEMDEEV